MTTPPLISPGGTTEPPDLPSDELASALALIEAQPLLGDLQNDDPFGLAQAPNGIIHLPPLPADELEAAGELYASADAANTRRGYDSDMRIFRDWCSARGADALPAHPLTVLVFLADEARRGVAVATIDRRCAAIAHAHAAAGKASPTQHPAVKKTMKGIRREYGTAPARQSRPLSDVELLPILHACGDSLAGRRDQALLALGFAGAFRRSELAGLHYADLIWRDADLVVRIARSKTDQDGRGAEKPILNGRHLLAVDRLKAWLDAAGITEGPVFRKVNKAGRVESAQLNDRSVARIVQRWALRAGLPQVELLAGHSLRAGFITSAGEHNVPLQRIMEVSLQRDPRTVLGYIRRANAFKNHAGGDFL